MKGEATEVPLKSWQFWSASRSILGDAFLQKVYQRGLRQLQRWSANPDFADDTERNPMDRYEAVLKSLVEVGRDEIARSAVMRQARIIGCDLTTCESSIPDKSNPLDELLDDLPPFAAFQNACHKYLSGDGSVTIEEIMHLEGELIRELKETRVKVLNDCAGRNKS